MKKKRVLVLAAALAGGSMLMTGLAYAFGPKYEANLSASANIPAGPKGATGKAKVYIKADQGRVCHTITYEKTRGELTAAHIHVGKKGVTGPIVVNLNVRASGDTSCVDADRQVLRAIVKQPSRYYVNLHTERFPDGVLRGQLHKG